MKFKSSTNKILFPTQSIFPPGTVFVFHYLNENRVVWFPTFLHISHAHIREIFWFKKTQSQLRRNLFLYLVREFRLVGTAFTGPTLLGQR